MHAFLRDPLIRLKPSSSSLLSHSLLPFDSLSTMSSSLLLPSISPQNLAIFEAPESLRSSNSVCFTGFKHGIRGFGSRNLDKSRVFMSVSVGSQTAVNDALFSDYKPTSAFLFPGQV